MDGASVVLWSKCAKLLLRSVVLADVLLESHCHRGSFRNGRRTVQPQTCVGNGLRRRCTEAGYLHLALLEIGEVVLQRFDALRREENQHVVVRQVDVAQVARHCVVEYGAGVFELVFVQQVGYLIVMDVAQRYEVRLVFVFAQHVNEVDEFAGRMENFALAVDDVFLQVNGDGLRDAEILHRLGYTDAQLFAQTEEMVDACSAGEDDCGVSQDVDFLLAELFGVNAFNMNELSEIELDVVLLLNLEVGRLWVGGLRLRN